MQPINNSLAVLATSEHHLPGLRTLRRRTKADLKMETGHGQRRRKRSRAEKRGIKSKTRSENNKEKNTPKDKGMLMEGTLVSG